MELLLILGVVGAAYYVSAKGFLREVKFKVGKIKFDAAKSASALFTKLYFNVEAAISNVTDFSITIKSVNLAIGYNGKTIATVRKTDAFSINPQATTALISDVQIDTLSLFSSLPKADQLQNIIEAGKLQYTITGSIDAGITVLSIDEKASVSL